MKGTVVLINPEKGMFVIEVEDGSFTVAGVLSNDDLEIDDVFVGDLQSFGSAELENLNNRSSVSVYIQEARCTAEAARKLIFD